MKIDDDFMGVPGRQVVLLGQLAIAAGHLEHFAWEICIDLGIDPRKRSFSEATREIQRIPDGELPDFARSTTMELHNWAAQAQDAMRSRNRRLHASFWRRRREDEWHPESVHLRSGTINREEDLRDLVEQLKVLSNVGVHLHLSLLREVKEGVLVRHRILYAKDPVVVVAYGDNPWATRPEPADVEAWINRYGLEILDQRAP